MKRICIVTSSHGRNDIRLFQKHTATLTNNGYYVIYVLNDGNPDEVGDNYRITTLGLHKVGKLGRFFNLRSRLLPRLLELNADLYQVCDPELISLGKQLNRHGKCAIFDSIEDWEGYFKGMFNPFIGLILSSMVSIAFKLYLKSYEKVLVMSPNIKQRLESYAPGKIEIVSNYPILKNYPINKIDMDDYIINRENRFIYCGSVYDFSVQELVVKAIKRISTKKANLTIVGSISNDRRRSIEDNGKEFVEFVPWVSKAELLDYYKKSICGVVIFDYTPVCCGKEGQMGSNKIFEYMLEGLPVICTDFILWKELIVDKYKCGICVNPRSESDIQNAIDYLLSHKAEAYEMGQRGQQAVLKEFNWESQAEKYLQIISVLTTD